MTSHERFVLLAAKQISERLEPGELADLEEHLEGCPPCRSIAAGMRRDDALLKNALGGDPVSPRVRRRVMQEATGRPAANPGLLIGIAAALALAVIGVPFVLNLGARGGPTPTLASDPTGAHEVSPAPPSGSSLAPSPTVIGSAPTAEPSGLGPYVAAAYTYGTPSRRDTETAHFDSGPVGEWSRRVPATGPGNSYGGPVTCLVISGPDAWLAGPATTATDGTANRAAFIYLHDGGPKGKGDQAILWLSTAGQTLETMRGWCETRFIPGGPFPLTSGDVEVHDGSR